MMQKFKWISALALITISPDIHAQAVSNDDVRYTVKSGDTLMGLAQRYFIRVNSYKIVQQKNRIANVYALPVGKTIMIPRSVMKYTLSQARVLSVRGNVSSGNGSVTTGQIFEEGAQFTTAPSSFLTLGLGNGSRVSLPSNSGLKIRTLRNYALEQSLDYDFDLSKGGAQSTVVPLKSASDRYRIRTPKAVSAVRGTDFQVRYDDETASDFAEVVEGGLGVEIGDKPDLPLPAGNGLAVMANGNAITETLLAEPILIDPGKVQADPAISFSATPAALQEGYRVTISGDAGFVEQLADQVITGTTARFDDLSNGNYFVRARAISANGIQGNPVTYTFKRRLNGVSAQAGKELDGYAFKWQSSGEGVSKFHFQLYQGAASGTAIVDEPAISTQQIILSDLIPGTYYWRVGSVQYLDGGASTNWTSFEKLNVAP
jgi:hypothetical protein